MPKALISVYNKEGIVDFSRQLVELGFEIIASGGTARTLSDAGIKVQDVASIVGGGEILGHRVVTLSREIHAGLLAKDIPEDREELNRLGVPFIDLACVDLYPLKEEISKPGSTLESVIEKTDIGGPTMLRSAAKGNRIVICDPADRHLVINWLKTGRPNEQEFINKLAAKAEAVIADYCLASARYRSGEIYDGIIGRQVLSCKYGENARQKPASLCAIDSGDPLAIDQFELVAGDAPSYNNICDLDRLLQTITHIAAAFDISFGRVPKIAIAVKHGNACGAATGEYRLQVIQDMIIGDTQAILGGIVMTNFMIDEEIAEEILTYNLGEGEERRKLDGIIAPFFSQNAIGMLRRKKDKCRFLANPHLGSLSRNNLDCARRFRYVRGGFLRQPNYTFVLDLNDPQIEKSGELTEGQKKRLLLAWAIGATSNSNTITLVGSRMLIGNGVAQQIRVGAAKLAITRAADADHDTVDAIAYSDSFFPQPDGPEVLVSAGVDVIFASSGSINDGKVKDFCKEAGIVLWLIPDAVGRGFYGH